VSSRILEVGQAGPIPLLVLLFALLLTASAPRRAPAQAYAPPPDDLTLQEPQVVNYPSAGILDHGSYRLEGRFGPGSSVLIGSRIGFHDRVQVGVYYGFQGLLERGSVDANPHPGLRARIRLIEEGALPALAIGFDNQGYGRWNDERERYQRKSPGFYFVVSRNYELLGDFSLSGGGNYTLENEDEDNFNIFGSAVKQVYASWSVMLEYDAALNDDGERAFGRGDGYLDAAVRWRYENLDIKFLLLDLLENTRGETGIARELEISYVSWF
jgi:hypothetical protein